MIERLSEYEITRRDGSFINVDCNTKIINTLVRKINELCDIINTIQKEREAERFEIQEWIGILEAVRKSVNIHEKQIDELQMKLEPHKCEPNAQDMYDNAILDALKDKQVDVVVEPVDNSEKANCQENVQDKFAEQRKCICKLCWFWNDDKADKVIGILTGVFDEADRPFERSIGQTLYKHCEPVKSDDDIIYKGGDNE